MTSLAGVPLHETQHAPHTSKLRLTCKYFSRRHEKYSLHFLRLQFELAVISAFVYAAPRSAPEAVSWNAVAVVDGLSGKVASHLHV